MTEQTPVPAADVLHERWLNVLAQFELWTQIWADNPELAKKAGTRVEELMMPIEAVHLRYADYVAHRTEEPAKSGNR